MAEVNCRAFGREDTLVRRPAVRFSQKAASAGSPTDEFRINRCIYDVFDSMPRYAEEALYQEALEIALVDAGIPFESQKEICPEFHGRKMKHTYRPDLICYGKIVVELKATRSLLPQHFGQLRN